MTTYNTGNPVGSPDPRDLYDNAENLDEAVNSTSDEWTDRLGRTRFTIEGITNLATDLGTAAYRDTVGAGDVYAREGIIGTVSQSGGTPTGAIIERGSNANGEYVKFADGTLKMTGTFAATVDIDNSSNIAAGWYRSDSRTQDFPAASVSDVKIVATMHRTTLGDFSVSAQAFRDEKTEARLIFTAPEQLISHDVKADYVAWGQWY